MRESGTERSAPAGSTCTSQAGPIRLGGETTVTTPKAPAAWATPSPRHERRTSVRPVVGSTTAIACRGKGKLKATIRPDGPGQASGRAAPRPRSSTLPSGLHSRRSVRLTAGPWLLPRASIAPSGENAWPNASRGTPSGRETGRSVSGSARTSRSWPYGRRSLRISGASGSGSGLGRSGRPSDHGAHGQRERHRHHHDQIPHIPTIRSPRPRTSRLRSGTATIARREDARVRVPRDAEQLHLVGILD